MSDPDVMVYEHRVAVFSKLRDDEPQRLCRRADCDHEAGDHSPVLLMECTTSDCDCTRFVWGDARDGQVAA